MSFISSLGEWLRKVSKSFMSATISGKTITLTRHNGDTVTLTTQDTTYEEASQSTSGLMSAEDKAILDAIPSTYAVKSGSLTDNPIIRTSQSGREANIINIGSDLTNSDTSETFDLGWNYLNRDGALLGLRSSSYSTEPGYFKLYARDEDNQSILQGTPNGELTWRDNQVITLVDTATTTKNGVMTAADKTKLDGISAGAEVNQNAFASVLVDNTNVAADTKSDTLTLVAGDNITLTADATNDKITIAATDTVYTHPTTSGNKHIPSGGRSGQILRWSADGTAAWGADNNTTYPAFSTGNTIAEGGYRDAMVMYDDDTSNRASVLRVTNGNGFHEILIGVNNESNGAPNGLFVRNTNGTITASLPGTLTVNDIKIGTGNIGSATKPVYINAGTITAGTYELNKTVPSDAKFTDTVTTASTSGSGNAVTSITASNGALTVKKDSTFIAQTSVTTSTFTRNTSTTTGNNSPVFNIKNGMAYINLEVALKTTAAWTAIDIGTLNKHPTANTHGVGYKNDTGLSVDVYIKTDGHINIYTRTSTFSNGDFVIVKGIFPII